MAGTCTRSSWTLWATSRGLALVTLSLCVLLSGGPMTQGAPVRTEKVLRHAYYTDIATLDPPRITRAPDYPIAMNLFNGLVRYKPGTTEIEPDLAEQWSVSGDGLTYTFRLRRGVKFHHSFGELTARDVKFSLERVLDPALGSPYASDIRQIRTIEIVDDYNLRIHMREPYSDFPSAVLAYRAGYVVSQQAVERFGDRFSLNPIGTGPYALEKYTPREELQFVAHADYFRGKPKIDRVIFKIVPEESVTILAMVKGDLDYTVIRTPEGFRLLKLYGRLGYTATPVTAVYAAVLNTKRPPLNDVRVRRALSHAIQRQEFVKTVLEGMGTDQGIWSVIPPGVFGHVPNVTTYQYDPTRARALLAEAGIARVRPLQIVHRPADRSIVIGLQGYWSQIGVSTTLEELDGAALDARLRAGTFDMYFLGPFRVAPDQFLIYLLSTSSPNVYGQIDDLVLAQRREPDEARRRAILRRIQEQVATDAPTIPLYRPTLVTAYRRVVTGDTPNVHYWLWNWDLMDVRN